MALTFASNLIQTLVLLECVRDLDFILRDSREQRRMRLGDAVRP